MSNKIEWAFPNVPKELVQKVDALVKERGNEMKIFSRADFIRIAIIEKIERVESELNQRS